MEKTPNGGSNEPPHTPDSIGASAFVFTMLDTTWRMFVPAVGFTLLGVWLDAVLLTKPWLMFAGIGFGAVLAYILVKRQVDSIRRGK